MHNFKELKKWQKGRALVKEIFLLTQNFPKEEQFILVDQMRRDSVSIPANIVEGSGRGSNKYFSRFIDIAMGSAFELESLIYIGYDLDYYDEKVLNLTVGKIKEIQKMLFHFKNHINS